jgi:hypothetical protein
MMQEEWFKNAVGLVSKPQGAQVVRFTSSQLDYYSAADAQRIRSMCSSGVMLDILTDSTFVEIDYSIGGRARNWAYFDLYVDGMYVGSEGEEETNDEDKTVRFDLSSVPAISTPHRPAMRSAEADNALSELRHVSIYLPHAVELFLKEIRMSEGSRNEPAALPSKRLLCLGDSITQGMEAKRPLFAYPVLLSRSLGMSLLNQGVGGYYFDKDSLDTELPYRPDLITVAYGTNDWKRWDSLEELRQRCGEYLDTLKGIYPDTPIAVLTPIWRQDSGQAQRMGTFEDMRQTIAGECARIPELRCIDGMRLLPHLPSFFGDPGSKLHPTDEGFLYMALELVKQLQST